MNPRLQAVIARAFDRPVSDIGPDARPETIAEWDSVGHISLIEEVEAEFGVRLGTDEILAIHSAADLERMLTARGVL
jgi:acyl carrier protein